MAAPTAERPGPDAAARAEIRQLQERVTDLRQQIAAAAEFGHALRTAANFADSERSGYIDRTGLERQ